MAETPERRISRIPGEGAGVIGYDPSKTPEAGSIGEYLNLQMTFKTIAAAQAALILPAVTRINTLFYDDNQAEGSGATYRRVGSEPSHPGKFQTLGGAWWEIALLTVNSRMFGAVGNGDPANMAADTYGAQRATDFSSATLKRIVEPVAHYCIDGYKGANAAWSGGEAASGGVIVRPGTVWHGAGRGLTIFHNTANNSRCVFRIRVDGKYTIKHMTVDVDRQNYTPIPYGDTTSTTGPVRGEGIIFEGAGVTYVTGIEFDIDDIEANNSGHYGIGAQNVKTGFGRIVNSTFRNPGGDGIDIKSFSTPDLGKTIYILNCHFPDGCGNYYLGTGANSEEATNENQTCIDASGATMIDGIHIDNLDSDPLSLGNCGIRVRPSVTSTNRLGGQRSIINNVRIRCSKPANTGSPTARRVVGIMVNAEEVQISNVTIDGAYWGVRLMESGDSIPSNCNLSNVTVLNCNGAANDGIGLSATAAVRRVNVANVQAKGNQIGLTVNCQGSSFQNVVLENNGLGVSATDGAISLNNFRNFRYSGNTLDHNATLSPRPGIALGGQPYGLTIYTASATLPLAAVGLTIQAQPAAAAVQLQMPTGAQTGDEIDVQKITGSGAGLVQVRDPGDTTTILNITDAGQIASFRWDGAAWIPVARSVSDRVLTLIPTAAASVATPPNGSKTIFIDSADGVLKTKDSAGASVGTNEVPPNVPAKAFWTDDVGGANLNRLNDRLFVGGATDLNGNSASPQGGAFANTNVDGATWSSILSTMVVDSQIGSMAITGRSRASLGSDYASIGVSGFIITDRANYAGWALYADVQHENNSTAYGLEIAGKNKSAYNRTSLPYALSGGVIGIWAAAGGDASYGGAPTFPSNSALQIGKNSQTWNRGIVFGADAITGTDGITGSGVAISLARGHVIDWRGPANINGASISSVVDVAGQEVSLQFQNNTCSFRGPGGQRIFDISNPSAGSVNYAVVQSAPSGSPTAITCAGSDANIGISITPKGSGVVSISNKISLSTGGIGFYGTTPIAKPSVTGSRGGNAALASLLTALASMGLITDGTTA